MSKIFLIFTALLFSLIYSGCTNDIPVNNTSSDNEKYLLEQNIASENKDVRFAASNWVIIDTLPYTITQPGNYKIKKDLKSSGVNGITITNTDHVTLNLNWYSLNALPSAVTEQTGVSVNNSSYVMIYNGDLNGYRLAFSFINSAECTAKNIEYTPSTGTLDVPPHYAGVRINNSPGIQVSWNVFNSLDVAVEITGSLSIDNKFLSNTCYGNPNPSTGRPTGVKISDTLSSPQKNIIRNNLFTGFDYGYNLFTKNGSNKVNSNTFEYYIEKGFNNDATNEFKYNTYTLLTH